MLIQPAKAKSETAQPCAGLCTDDNLFTLTHTRRVISNSEWLYRSRKMSINGIIGK